MHGFGHFCTCSWFTISIYTQKRVSFFIQFLNVRVRKEYDTAFFFLLCLLFFQSSNYLFAHFDLTGITTTEFDILYIFFLIRFAFSYFIFFSYWPSDGTLIVCVFRMHYLQAKLIEKVFVLNKFNFIEKTSNFYIMHIFNGKDS